MPKITVKAGQHTIVIPRATAELVETTKSRHERDDDGAYRLVVAERSAMWTFTSTEKVQGWLGGIHRRSWPGGVEYEYSLNADLIDDVTVT